MSYGQTSMAHGSWLDAQCPKKIPLTVVRYSLTFIIFAHK